MSRDARNDGSAAFLL